MLIKITSGFSFFIEDDERHSFVENGKEKHMHNKAHNKVRNIEKKNIPVENKEIIDLYDEAKRTGNWDKVSIKMVEKFEPAIYKSIRQNNFQKVAEIEDLVSAGRVAILSKIKEYDPRRSMPSSYFLPNIDSELKRTATGETKMTTFYSQKASELTKAAKKYGYRGLDDPTLTEITLAKISGESQVTIRNVMKLKGYTTVSLDDAVAKPSPGGVFGNPAEYVVDQDLSMALAIAYNQLTPYEQLLVREILMNITEPGNSTSIIKLANRLAKAFEENPELMEENGLDKAPDCNKIKADAARVQRKLRHNPEVLQRFNVTRRVARTPYTVVEQASEETIMKAFEDVKQL